jgi:peptide/nickel transport system permease protein
VSAVAGAAEVHPETISASVEGRSPRQIVWGRLRQDRAAMLGLGVIIVLVLLSALAGVIARLIGHGPNDVYNYMTDDFGIPKGPNSHFWFGADGSGRDLFVRVLYGARTSLLVAGVATAISMTIGVTVGVVAGYYRGFTDTIVMRFSDVMLALPQLLLAIGIAASCGVSANGCLNGLVQPGLSLVIFVISAFTWPYIARIVRSTTLSLREKEFVEAARSLGATDRRIIFREILPNLVAPIIVYATILIPQNILYEAALSFLGVGVDPSKPSWGAMISDATDIFQDAWWFMVFPGLALLLTVLAFNIVGDGLQDALNPRTSK